MLVLWPRLIGAKTDALMAATVAAHAQASICSKIFARLRRAFFRALAARESDGDKASAGQRRSRESVRTNASLLVSEYVAGGVKM